MNLYLTLWPNILYIDAHTHIHTHIILYMHVIISQYINMQSSDDCKVLFDSLWLSVLFLVF